MAHRTVSRWSVLLALFLMMGVIGSTVGTASASSSGEVEGTRAIVGDARAVGVAATYNRYVRFCSPYDENPSCADQNGLGVLVGHNFSPDFTFTYTQLSWWSLIYFQLPSDLDGATVNSASLRMYPSFIGAQAYSTSFDINAISQNWTPTAVTANTDPNVYSLHEASLAGGSLLADTAAFWDVTSIAAKWANGSWDNYGLMLSDANFTYPGYTRWTGSAFYHNINGDASDGRVPSTWVPYLIIDYTPAVTWTCNGVVATIVGTTGDDSLVGTSGPDVIVGLDGNDKIFGKGGDDLICAGPGNDTVLGKAGRDTIVGEDGNDTLWGGEDKDRLFGSNGKDTLYGEGHNDILKGGRNIDRLWGGLGNDRMFGGAGNDQMNGQRGNDLMWGHRGDDTISGGPGTDEIDGGLHTDTCDGEFEVNCDP